MNEAMVLIASYTFFTFNAVPFESNLYCGYLSIGVTVIYIVTGIIILF